MNPAGGTFAGQKTTVTIVDVSFGEKFLTRPAASIRSYFVYSMPR